MALNIVDVAIPDSPVVGTDCRIRCTVKNTGGSTVEARVYLYEGSTELNHQPDVHWENVGGGEEFAFNSFWNTLHFTPKAIRDHNLKLELHQQGVGRTDYRTFTISTIAKPDWWDGLLDSLGIVNTDWITEPIMGLFTGFEIEGWTTPPFRCFICGATFSGATAEDDFSNHLVSHLEAFTGGWFK